MNKIIGGYYLHLNGDLIYKRDLGSTAADIRESDFARALWPVDPSSRTVFDDAWTMLVEALSAGASSGRVKELADKWGCNDDDAQIYAQHVGCSLERDGNFWCATRLDFKNIQESPCGFGETCLEAMAELAKALGYKPSKMWGHSFPGLLRAKKGE